MRMEWVQQTREQGPGAMATVQIFNSVRLPVEVAYSPFGHTVRRVFGSQRGAASLRTTDSYHLVSFSPHLKLFGVLRRYLQCVCQWFRGFVVGQWCHQIRHLPHDDAKRPRQAACSRRGGALRGGAGGRRGGVCRRRDGGASQVGWVYVYETCGCLMEKRAKWAIPRMRSLQFDFLKTVMWNKVTMTYISYWWSKFYRKLISNVSSTIYFMQKIMGGGF